jgi:hypothetical protein
MAGLEGQTFAGYEVVSLLGRGVMGAVWKARQPMLNRFAALKIMAPELAADAEFVKRFKREATAAANLSHEHLVQVYSAGEFEGTHYIAMEFVEGETLRERIERHGKLDPCEAVAITTHVAEALLYAWNTAGRIPATKAESNETPSPATLKSHKKKSCLRITIVETLVLPRGFAVDRVLRTRFRRSGATASAFGERAPPSVAVTLHCGSRASSRPKRFVGVGVGQPRAVEEGPERHIKRLPVGRQRQDSRQAVL